MNVIFTILVVLIGSLFGDCKGLFHCHRTLTLLTLTLLMVSAFLFHYWRVELLRCRSLCSVVDVTYMS